MFGRASEPKARGHDPEGSLAALAAAEPRFLESGAQAESQRFHVLGKWCLSAPFLSRLLRGPQRARAWAEFGAISSISMVGLAALLPRRTVLEAPSRAAALVLRNNIRAVYPELGLTVKLANPARPESRGDIRNEAALRGHLRGTGRIGLPAMHRTGNGDMPYIVEEFIVGAERRKAVPADFASDLFAFYEANGIGVSVLRDLADLSAAVEAFARGCRLLGVEVPGRLADFYRSQGAGHGERVLQGVCHGDLAPSNLLFESARTLIVDWEYARRDLLFSDIVRLASRDEGFLAGFLSQARGWSERSGVSMLAPQEQLMLGCLIAANQRLERFETFLSSTGRAALVGKYRAKVQTIVDLAARMSAGASRD